MQDLRPFFSIIYTASGTAAFEHFSDGVRTLPPMWGIWITCWIIVFAMECRAGVD